MSKVFPAYAGVFLNDILGIQSTYSVPRIRGGVPGLTAVC